ncbi:hypothetical protein [Jeotgalibacillus soli]|nr:hypothetical protein [Jeotgalibacillus soli]
MKPITTKSHSYNYNSKEEINIFLHQCPDCFKNFVTTHLRKNKEKENIEFISCYPSTRKSQFSRLVEDTSPKFIDIYNQAFSSEQQNHFEVAGVGYRLALEFLVKDFAIKALKQDEAEVKSKKLFEALKDYVDTQGALTSEEVVRVLGNDFIYYGQKQEQIEFNLLKWYLDIFIQQIETKLKLLHPPVASQQVEKQIQS